jgi:citrate lyase subunit alpha/citrate CoA-transferase
MNKLAASLREAIEHSGLKDGMTISFHHHLRNGDHVVNIVLNEIADMGIKDLTVASSSFFQVHEELVRHIKNGVITRLDTNYMVGPLARAVSMGILNNPVVFRSHGGRPRAIHEGSLNIDVAFVAAPSSDEMGNINGVTGPSACGSLGYAMPDALCARKVIAVTDYIVPYPNSPISIDQTYVDWVVKVDSIGDPAGIVSGTTRVTRDPIGHIIAGYAAEVIDASGLLKDGISFQTGAGGASLATAYHLKEKMLKKNIKGSFGLGGITGFFVDMLKQGLFEKLIDVQCFDLDAVRSLRDNPNHIEVSASFYANPGLKGCAVDKLDVVVLGATEIDTGFNVNVLTDSNGIIMGGSGGHSDTAAGAKLTIIVANLLRSRLPIVVDKVTNIVTPGNTVDVLVTERGIAVNPARTELRDRLKDSSLPVVSIEELKDTAERIAGKPTKISFTDRVVGLVEYRDGTIIDKVYSPATDGAMRFI